MSRETKEDIVDLDYDGKEIKEETVEEVIDVEVVSKPKDTPTKDMEKIMELKELIDEKDLLSILDFGNEASEEITRVSDILLSKTTPEEGQETAKFIQKISTMVEDFNPDHLNISLEPPKEQKGLLGFIKRIASPEETDEEKSNKIAEKLTSMKDQTDGMAMNLRHMQRDTAKNDADLTTLEEASIDSYKRLGEFIEAGNLKIEDINNMISDLEAEGLEDPIKNFEYQNLIHAKSKLEQKIFNLKVSEQVALQTLPQIQIMKHNNVNIAIGVKQAIDSTLPMLKKGLAVAVINKNQELTNQAISSINNASSEIMKRNTKNVMESSKKILETNTNLKAYRDIALNYQELKKGIESIKVAKDKANLDREEANKELDRIKQEVKTLNLDTFTKNTKPIKIKERESSEDNVSI